ncbi:MAG: glucoamylase family protein [Pseudomonadota bacterium]
MDFDDFSEDLPLSSELFNLEQLKRHSKSLATRHELVSGPGDDQLIARLGENEYVLAKAYESLCSAVHDKQTISPAGEWLLDNFHLIEEQIRTARRHLPRHYCRMLPHLAGQNGQTGIPRVYDIALEIIKHVDGRVDNENMKLFVDSYQEQSPLKLGELWAIPIMLRLALIENLRRVAVRVVSALRDRQQAKVWSQLLVKASDQDPKSLILVVANLARSNPHLSNAFVAEFVRGLHGHSRTLDIPLTWLTFQLEGSGRTIAQTIQLESHQQATNQVSVSASIGSLRHLDSTNWQNFVESASAVESVLRMDPAKVYASMAFSSRDQYRHSVERLSKKYKMQEWDVAQKAVSLSENYNARSSSEKKRHHIGYFLIGSGLPDLEAALKGKKSSLRVRMEVPFLIFISSIFSITAVIVSLTLYYTIGLDVAWEILLPILVLIFIVGSQIGVKVTNGLVTTLRSPKRLPRMDYSKGIPQEFKTLVAVPSMLITLKNIEALISSLEVRYLANRDANLYFCLLTDFIDASSPSMGGDFELLQSAKNGIYSLNDKYRRSSGRNEDIFYLFHRPRVWNSKEKLWMGYERKRGKLEALNSALRGFPNFHNSSEPLFCSIVGDIRYLQAIKYVITLDSDTQLPSGTAHTLIGIMSHPLNAAVLSHSKDRVMEGYGILQPRVAVCLPGAYRSWFVRLYGGDAGTDPYTRAVSDVYQDLFEEGSFIGKGIYDVDVFRAVLERKLPENLILSHDLLEGAYCRCGLVSDVILYEEHPSHFGEDVKRRRRWIRGDWQIAFWLLPWVPGFDGKWRKNSLSALSRWKIFDNLRRSLVPVATLILLVSGWYLWPGQGYVTRIAIAAILLPSALILVKSIFNKHSEISYSRHFQLNLTRSIQKLTTSLLGLTFLPFDLVTNTQAIGRFFVRKFVTHTRLLEWQSSSDPRHQENSDIIHFFKFMGSAPSIAILVGAVLSQKEGAIASALPFLLIWFLSPIIAFILSRIHQQVDSSLKSDQLQYLHQMARKNWRFFETFVGPEDHWLPPDNFQELPNPVLAHRTSPTNIGLSLLANLAAYDFSYISVTMLLERTSHTFQTLHKLERFRGHFYNWYDTRSLAPLPPFYVSTVDSGNFIGLILTLRPGLMALPKDMIVLPRLLLSLGDAFECFLKSFFPMGVFHSKVASIKNLLLNRDPSSLKTIQDIAKSLRVSIAEMKMVRFDIPEGRKEEFDLSIKEIEDQITNCLLLPLSTFTPWCHLPNPPISLPAGLLAKLDQIPTLESVETLVTSMLSLVDGIDTVEMGREEMVWLILLKSELRNGMTRARTALSLVEKLCREIDYLACVEYDFLYDKSRNLLAIGYNVTERRRDDGFYDLLASEARLCSFVGIAQGLLPQEHWFALGRSLTEWKNIPTLLSWSGSMFEYLMPLVVMPTFSHTILDQTFHSVVGRQMEYGSQRRVPWGISESGYNATDIHLNYQYKAFGVPGLGLKRGLAEDLVIAPYASMMALMVNPTAACINLQRMTDLGYEGKYGFYEAVDFTTSRSSSKKGVILNSFMAHHQGMGFLALAYVLLDRKMQSRFQSVPEFQAVELLLHERVPEASVVFPHAPEASLVTRWREDHKTELRVIPSPNTPKPEIHLLSNGRYTVMLTNSGGGFSRWKNLAITRWREDPTSDHWGTFCYIRDLENEEVWSASYHPIAKSSDQYEAIFPQAKAEFRRSDEELEMHTEITVSPEDDIELRRFSITNRASRRRVVELTSYAEIVLGPAAADDAHPAFSNLFVQTEILASKKAILCKRRPRSSEDTTPVVFHLMCAHGAVVGDFSFETDRSKFIGRGRSTRNPLAMEPGPWNDDTLSASQMLSGSDGSVLDPIVAIRSQFVIEAEQTFRVHCVTGVGESRENVLHLIEKYHDRHVADRVFELAWTHTQVTCRQAALTETNSQLYERLAGIILYSWGAVRADSSTLLRNKLVQSGLWGYGISGNLPILLLKITSQENMEIARQLIQAHSYWRTMRLEVEFVIWLEDLSSYRQVLYDSLMNLITSGGSSQLIDVPGGIFILRAEQMSGEDRVLIQTVARAVILGNGGSLQDQIERRMRSPLQVSYLATTRAKSSERNKVDPDLDLIQKGMLYPNAFGGFASDGRSYQIRTRSNHVTPAPWANVLANPYFGSVVSESGSSYTWCENAHEFRLTPWSNDALSDSSGEAFYLRDEDSGEFWSPTPLPARTGAPYTTHHGFGYSKFLHESAQISSELVVFVAIDAPVKMTVIKLKNNSTRSRSISITGYCEWVLGESRPKSLMHVSTELDPETDAIFARNPYHPEFGARIAFFASSEKVKTVTGDRTEFLGRNGHLGTPDAMYRTSLSGRLGPALDPCAALHSVIKLEAGSELTVSFLLGVGRDERDAKTLIKRFGSTSSARLALEEVEDFWRQTLSAVQIKTPDPAVDVLANGWLVYQTLACRIWARSGSYQSGGAFGFRDQLQDAMALLHTAPNLLRRHLLKCASRQFREGDVQHWWHPPSGRGVRTRISDDYLWLPLATSRYVLGIGDTGVLDVRIEFLEGREVKPDEEAYMDLPSSTEETATLYDHCVRAIRHGLTLGENGLPLMGYGDWNDGMNLVGKDGKGESVWLAFFLFDVLSEFSKVAELHGDMDFAGTCREHANKLSKNIDRNAWDGKWYRRAYFDNGQPLGSATNAECQIDSLPQSWSVLSKASSRERSEVAMASVSERLVDRKGGIIKLFDPPFDTSELEPGYIKGYVPGVRENGGQYTHAAIWSAMAFAALGKNQQAWELLHMINPVNHALTESDLEIYKVEPYVMAADVYAVEPHVGRGGWTWYTGSAGWMYRLILESLLGITLKVDRLFFQPCVPDDWNSYQVKYRYRSSYYHIEFRRNKAPESKGLIIADQVPQKDTSLLLVDDSLEHHIEVLF